MKKGLRTIMIGIAFLSVYQSAKGQFIINEADVQFELFNYVKAIDLYEQAWKKKETLHAAERLAMAYETIQNYEKAESWNAIAANMKGSAAISKLNYAKALQNNGKYGEAKQQYQQYAKLADKTVSIAQLNIWILSCDSAMRWMRSPKPVVLENVGPINSSQSDWGATAYAGGMVFGSDRNNGAKLDKTSGNKPFLKFDGDKLPDKKIYGWTGNSYFHLYFIDSLQRNVQLFPVPTGTNYHMAAPSFNNKGNEVYFTLTRIPKSGLGKGQLGTINVEIYSSHKDTAGNWGIPVPFIYNKVGEYGVGDPFLTNDGNTLYFSSNMPGGMGGTDIYVCFRTNGGAWGRPINLKEVNTEGNERTPTFDKDNNFYFSSDGRVGMGGLDIYKGIPNTKGSGIGIIANMGYPINSPQDDFAFNANISNGKLYFASNRMGGQGNDDIYSYTEQRLPIVFKLQGVVYNKQTKIPLASAVVSLEKIEGNSLKIETDSAGRFSFVLQENSDYKLTGDKTDFRSDEKLLSTVGLKKPAITERFLYLEPIEINKAIRLENIYYDFDKANIRPDAAKELDKLIRIMQENPTIWIELGSHTDSRGNDEYNQWLSQSRANSAVQYMIDKGIAKNRITANGYGESRLLNHCANGIKCSEAEHQLNRRTEFKITKQ